MLISVKNLAEAHIVAANEGVSIIDVKDPLQGSLGFAGAAIVNQIAAMVQEKNGNSNCGMIGSCHSRKKLVSVALGELRNLNTHDFEQIDWEKINFAKIGLSGAYKDLRWRNPVANFFANVPNHVSRVLVLYVDQINAAASNATLAAACKDGMSVVLLDTFDKTQGNVFAHWSETDCEKLFNAASKFAMRTVLAGSVGVSDLPFALNAGADLIGVRGAVCDKDRKGDLSQKRLSNFIKTYSEAATNHCCNTRLGNHSFKQSLGEPG